jgi:hypothetical protein
MYVDHDENSAKTSFSFPTTFNEAEGSAVMMIFTDLHELV